MPRKRTPEEIRRLKKRGLFDVGTSYLRVGGFSKEPKQTYWDEEDEDVGEENRPRADRSTTSKVVEINELQGGCHCEALKVTFTTQSPPADIKPRICDCTFCVKHAAAYISDPDGSLAIQAIDEESLGRYQQGTDLTDFLVCTACGVLVGVIADLEGMLLGAVNARCLDDWKSFGQGTVVSPRLLSTDEKINRWKSVWVQDVQIKFA